MKIGIVDYGMGNLKSVTNTLRFLGVDWTVVQKAADFRAVSGLIIPGVGAFDKAMVRIKEGEFDLGIQRAIEKGKPVLGICLGMQILFEMGYEGEPCQGLNLIKGRVAKITGPVKIPHMGWNTMELKVEHPLMKDIPDRTQFYFVHSYCVADVNERNIIGTTSYGVDFPSAVFKDNVTGVQFHPEKSGNWGIKILENFREMVRCC